MIPSTPAQLLTTLVLVLPGFVFQEIRIRLRGRAPGEQDVTGRLLRAIALSLAFSLVYALALGPSLADVVKDPESVMADPRRAAGLSLLLGLLLPALAAVLPTLVGARLDWSRLFEKLRLGDLNRYDSTPSAWDRAFENAGPCFVRVRMKDGTWFAGYYGHRSYASSFPDPRSMFLEASFSVDDAGQIGGPVSGTVGAVIDCSDAVLVELLSSGEEEPADDGAESSDAELSSSKEETVE